MILKKIFVLIFSLLLIIIIAEAGFILYYSPPQENLSQTNNNNSLVNDNNLSFKNIASKYTVPYILSLGEDLDAQLIEPKNIIMETEYMGKIEKISFSKGKIGNFNYNFYITLISERSGKKINLYFNDQELQLLKITQEKDPLKKMNLEALKKGDIIKSRSKFYLFYPPDKSIISSEIIKIN